MHVELRQQHLGIECGALRPGRLPAELRKHKRLAEVLRARVHMRIDPAAREAQRSFLGAATAAAAAAGQPGVGPEVDAGKVDVRRRVVAHKVAAQREAVEGVVCQELCPPAEHMFFIHELFRSISKHPGRRSSKSCVLCCWHQHHTCQIYISWLDEQPAAALRFCQALLDEGYKKMC